MLEILKIYWTLLRTDRRGVTAVEYAVIAGVLVTAVATAFTTLGTRLESFFNGLTF